MKWINVVTSRHLEKKKGINLSEALSTPEVPSPCVTYYEDLMKNPMKAVGKVLKSNKVATREIPSGRLNLGP